MEEDEAAQAKPGTLARFSLAGKRALVTGASRGLGRVIALALAEAGADIVISARDAAALDGVAEEIRGLGRQAAPVVADLAERGAARMVVAEAWECLGSLDVVVACAGIS